MAEKIKLWGRANSANVQKVVWALEELGLAYERVDVGGKFGGLDNPEYEALNPNRLVPAFQDGDLTMWESHAIVRYLAATYGEDKIWPAGPRQRALVDQWTDWTSSTFQPAWLAIFVYFVRTPSTAHDAAALKAIVDKANAAFEIIDRNLADKPFLAGDTLSYADIVAGTSLYRWTNLNIERPTLPNVEAWHQRLLARPAFVKGVCVPFADMLAK